MMSLTLEQAIQVGWKPTKDEDPNFKCRKCGSDEILYTESSGDHEDIHYWCTGCKRDWWYEGADY